MLLTLSQKLNVLASPAKDVNWTFADLNPVMALQLISIGTIPSSVWFFIPTRRFDILAALPRGRLDFVTWRKMCGLSHWDLFYFHFFPLLSRPWQILKVWHSSQTHLLSKLLVFLFSCMSISICFHAAKMLSLLALFTFIKTNDMILLLTACCLFSLIFSVHIGTDRYRGTFSPF